nr:ribonuclease H-like domain-containing protein [Tanacetum cinerariifolium]
MLTKPEWNTHAVVWRNKADLDTITMDDLYNNLKVYKPKVKGMSSFSSSTQNMAFVSSSNNNSSSTNGTVNTIQAVNTANAVSTASTQAEEGLNYALMAYTSSNSDSKVSNDSTCSQSCLETVKLLKSQNEQLLKDLKKSELMVLGYKAGYENYNAVPPPYIGNFMPLTLDLFYTGLYEFANKTVVENKSSEEETKSIRKDTPIIEE